MPGILDLFGNPANQGILSTAAGLLNASGPSRMPVSFGQALGQGFQQGSQAYQSASNLQQMEQLRKLQGLMYAAQAQRAMTPAEPGTAVDATGVRRYLNGPMAGQVVRGFETPTPVKPTESPSSVREFEYAQKNGYKGTYEQWVKEKQQAGATTVTVTPSTSENPFYKGLGEGESKSYLAEKNDAVKSAQSMQVRQEARKLLDSGVITGSGAEFVTNAGKVLERLGIPLGKDATETVHNTQVYAASMGREVGSVIRMFGSGTGLSDADRAYAEKIAGGKIELDEGAIRKLLDINDRLDKAKLRSFNKKAKQVETGPGYGLPYKQQIPIPGEPAPGEVVDGWQFTGGDPGNRMNWRKAK